MGMIILGSGTPNNLQIDSNAARVVLYDSLGNPLLPLDSGVVVPGAQRGFPNLGVDYRLGRLLRASPDASLRAGADTMVFYDSIEGAAYDSNKWVQTLTGQVIAQAVSTGTQYNSGAVLTVTTGAMMASQRRLPFIGRNALAYRTKVRATAHSNGNVIEYGLANPPAAATTVIVPDGAFWRKDGTGQYVPVVSINGAEILGTPISNATFITAVPVTAYALFNVFLEESRATFQIVTQSGVLVNSQVVEFQSTIGTFGVTHLQAFAREYNNTAVVTAVQLFVAQTSVWLTDQVGAPFQNNQSGLSYGSLTSPTLYTQLANYVNNTAPASATLSNTAAGYTTLGGQYQFAAVAGAETDYALFAYTVPATYNFIATGVRITVFNTVVAVATTPTLMQWGLGFNGATVNLSTGAAMRKAIGTQSLPIGAVPGTDAPAVQWNGIETVYGNRVLTVILKMPVATATATEIIRGTVDVEGYFE